jgi:hypothetical protein
MQNAELRRVYHKLCAKKGYDDSEKAFRIFMAGIEYAETEGSIERDEQIADAANILDRILDARQDFAQQTWAKGANRAENS